jgi:uncharacterized membrane protein YedE/YeeE
MLDVLPSQLPWWVAGPGVGLCVVALYGLVNRKLGVSGGWLQVVYAVQRRPVTEGWRLFFNGGLVLGAVVAAVLGAAPAAPLLLAVGIAIGYGARWAGGCTSGHGISGCAAGSPDSLAATCTFFTVAVVVTLVVHQLSGGAV